MEISGPNPTPVTPATVASMTPSAVEAWKVGQLVNATVIAPHQSGQVVISVAGTALLAQSPIPLQPGQTLQLEVTQLAALATLKLLSAERTTPPVTITVPPQAGLIAPWHKGAILAATLSRVTDAGLVKLVLGEQTLDARVSQPLAINQQLKLEVLHPGALAALRILNPAPTSDAVNHVLRRALAQQAPLPSVLESIAAMANGTLVRDQRPVPLPPAVITAAQAVMAQLPSAGKVTTAEGLQQAMQQSGLFLEGRLAGLPPPAAPAQTSPNPIIDFKGSLLSLLDSLFTLSKASAHLPVEAQASLAHHLLPPATTAAAPPAPPGAQPAASLQLLLQQAAADLLRSVESGIAKVLLNQVASANTEDDGKRSWLLDLPVRQDDRINLFQLRIDREGKSRNKKQPAAWSVNLSFDLETLGPIQVRVTLAGGIINTTFWARRPSTMTLINENLDGLRRRMTRAGINVGSIHAFQGAAPEPVTEMPPLSHVLLDVKA